MEAPIDNQPGGNEGGEAMAARAGGAGPGGGVAKETPISTYPSLSYGVQETHTTVLPWTGWISAGGLDKGIPAQLKIRMNSPYDMLDVDLDTVGATDGAFLSTKGFFHRPFDTDGRYSTSNGVRFPQEFADGSNSAAEAPAWREYWAQLYDYYTVLGCEYEIILYNPLQTKAYRVNTIKASTFGGTTYPAQFFPVECGSYNCDCVVGTQFDTYSETATSTGNVMPPTLYEEVRQYKNIRWTPVKGGQTAVIRGTYKPGDAKRNIVNDGEVKTWSAVGAKPTTYNEILTLNFWTDPFFNARGNDAYTDADGVDIQVTGGAMYGTINMEINLKYIVQFKDLKVQARYPNTLYTNQDITQSLADTDHDALMKWAT